MYIIMYKYSTFKIKRKSFRSSMSKNFTVIPDLLRLPVKPAMTVGPRHGNHFHVMADLIGHLLCHLRLRPIRHPRLQPIRHPRLRPIRHPRLRPGISL